MITLKAPPITQSQRKELESHKAKLEAAIAAAAQHSDKLSELSNLETSLERKAASLRRRAAKFELDAESELSATEKQIERVIVARKNAESVATSIKPFQVIVQAHELIQKICQHSYHELLSLIASAMAPFYLDWPRAKFEARNVPAVAELVRDLLKPPLFGTESVEVFDDAAKRTLARLDALLTGSEIWRFPGCEPPPASEEIAA